MVLLAGAGAYVLALFCGTAMGWIVKYTLDKHYVFKHETHSRVQLAGNMATHASTGVIFTLVFWTIETLFLLFVDIPGAMYLGAIVGLSLSYLLRYQVDRLIVFRSHPEPI